MQLIGDGFGCDNRLPGQCWRQIALVNLSHRQNAVAVRVQLHRQVDAHTVPATRNDHRTLCIEWQQLLQHAGHLLELIPGARQLCAGFDSALALAVITHSHGFENAR